MQEERVGFIGLGYMGHGMAKNIVEKGYRLTVMAHRNRTPVEDLKGRGATEVRTPKEIAEASSIVFLCVTGSKEVEQVVRGPEGLKAGARPARSLSTRPHRTRHRPCSLPRNLPRTGSPSWTRP